MENERDPPGFEQLFRKNLFLWKGKQMCRIHSIDPDRETGTDSADEMWT